ncbi:MAG: hypothetical protein EXR58_05505 [Chloroflexi bacterium]|nr:hypothetical protein [Chloroflexota bacterium]
MRPTSGQFEGSRIGLADVEYIARAEASQDDVLARDFVGGGFNIGTMILMARSPFFTKRCILSQGCTRRLWRRHDAET